MATENWLPIGFELPDGAHCGKATRGGADWQIVETADGGSALLARAELAARWTDSGLVEERELLPFAFGAAALVEVSCGPGKMLAQALDCRSPQAESEALAFAMAFRATRAIDALSSLRDAIYVEKLSRLLPTYSATDTMDDGVVVGAWLTGGARVSAESFRQLRGMLTWMSPEQLRGVVTTAGFAVKEIMPADPAPTARSEDGAEGSSATARGAEGASAGGGSAKDAGAPFTLPGRPELEAFFNEHVVDVIVNKKRYAALGVGFPGAVVLHGPPGCGKTFAVERLVDHLGWPSFQIDASSVASPYIHETSKKVAEVFEKAMQSAPSVLVIDEMEAFLADRSMGGGGSHHRVEEVAEFLRRIPEAAANEVLIVAMTNRVDMIDAAIMRRGRFDHVIKVDYASAQEVLALLGKLLEKLPQDGTVDPAPLAEELAGRPLSDVAFMVREGARLAAKSGADKLGQAHLLAAMDEAPSRTGEEPARRIGFV